MFRLLVLRLYNSYANDERSDNLETFSINHSLSLDLFSMRSQHAAIAMITHNNLLLMKEMKEETILKLFVGMSGLKIVPTKAPMPRKNVSIKNEILQVSQ